MSKPVYLSRKFFIAALFFLLIQNACLPFGKIENVRRNMQRSDDVYTSQSSAEPKLKKGESVRDDRPFADFEREILGDLRSENFRAIDLIADAARQSRERFTGGYWKLKIIYECLTIIFTDEFVTEEMWTEHLERLKRWKQKSPDSITARIALAESYKGYGWFARGTGFSNTITDEDSGKLHERLELAYRELLEADKLKERCPEWYEAMLFLATAQSWSEEDFDRLFEEAIKFEPNYYYYYYSKAENSSPRWGGRKGDLEKVIFRIERLDSQEKDILYYLYASLIANSYYKEWTDRRSISWEKAKRGYDQLEKTYGVDKQRLNQYSFIAAVNEDMPEAYRAFKKIGDDWDDKVYSEQRFNEIKSWAIARYEAENPK